ncbi:MAG TPA: hypothetical protein VL691_11150, partial [Vicinamibacteria bacterium]|nr:hypothetical protein [Vicinamibacteria bacterium]
LPGVRHLEPPSGAGRVPRATTATVLESKGRAGVSATALPHPLVTSFGVVLTPLHVFCRIVAGASPRPLSPPAPAGLSGASSTGSVTRRGQGQSRAEDAPDAGFTSLTTRRVAPNPQREGVSCRPMVGISPVTLLLPFLFASGPEAGSSQVRTACGAPEVLDVGRHPAVAFEPGR